MHRARGPSTPPFLRGLHADAAAAPRASAALAIAVEVELVHDYEIDVSASPLSESTVGEYFGRADDHWCIGIDGSIFAHGQRCGCFQRRLLCLWVPRITDWRHRGASQSLRKHLLHTAHPLGQGRVFLPQQLDRCRQLALICPRCVDWLSC